MLRYMVLISAGISISCGSSFQKSDVSLTLTLNPSGKSPLSAQAEITLPSNNSFDVTVITKGKSNSSTQGITISHTFSNRQGSFTLPVLGLYPAYTNQIEFGFFSSENQKVTLTRELVTSSLSTNIVVPIEIFKNQLNPEKQSVYLVDNLKIAFDQQGEIRWAYTGDSFLNYGKLANGNLVVTSEEDLLFLYHYPKFYEVTMLGEIVYTYDISKYYGHHDIWEITKGDYQGHLLVSANESNPGTNKNAGHDGVGEEDYILLVERNTGTVIKEWDLKKLFDIQEPNRHRLPSEPSMHPDDWIHLNSLYHDPEDNTIVFSSRHLSAVVKFDFNSEKLVWIITDNTPRQWSSQTNFYGQVIADYVLRPITAKGESIIDPGADNFWPYGQHAAKRIGGKNGNENILLFDNGNYRNFFQYGNNRKKEYYSRAVEYKVDRTRMTVEKVWEYDAGKKYYTLATGGADLLPNQNRMIGFMWTSKNKSTPRVIELTPLDKVVFEARFNQGKTFYYQVGKFSLYQGLD